MKYLLSVFLLLLGNCATALDATSPLKLPEHYELLAISSDQTMWFGRKKVTQQQLIAAVLYLKTTEDLQVVAVSADRELDKESEFYKQLIDQLSKSVKVVAWEDL